MLAEGQCIYSGNIAGLVPFLASQGFVCPAYHNPADYGLLTLLTLIKYIILQACFLEDLNYIIFCSHLMLKFLAQTWLL